MISTPNQESVTLIAFDLDPDYYGNRVQSCQMPIHEGLAPVHSLSIHIHPRTKAGVAIHTFSCAAPFHLPPTHPPLRLTPLSIHSPTLPDYKVSLLRKQSFRGTNEDSPIHKCLCGGAVSLPTGVEHSMAVAVRVRVRSGDGSSRKRRAVG
jgi:hypothetical protein